jgi:hypothetical protein
LGIGYNESNHLLSSHHQEHQMKYVISLLLCLVSLNAKAEDIKATTTDGKSVLLHADGKWEFVLKPEQESVFSFRKTNWGMSKAQVKKLETGKILNDDDVLMYEGNIAGLETYIVYNFVDDKLVRASYIYKERHSNKSDYLSDYLSVQKILINKYGKPAEEETLWKNDLYKDDYQEWGMALAVGHLVKYCVWNVSDTEIAHLISGDNFDINHGVEYKSVSLAGLERSKVEETVNENF